MPEAPGERGPAGSQGPKGIQGESGEVGVTYIRRGKKTCPNSGATLVYEGNIRDRGRSVIEGAHIHIFGFTNRENNQFQKKLMRQNPNI